jgi:hypothetical protein
MVVATIVGTISLVEFDVADTLTSWFTLPPGPEQVKLNSEDVSTLISRKDPVAAKLLATAGIKHSSTFTALHAKSIVSSLTTASFDAEKLVILGAMPLCP